MDGTPAESHSTPIERARVDRIQRYISIGDGILGDGGACEEVMLQMAEIWPGGKKVGWVRLYGELPVSLSPIGQASLTKDAGRPRRRAAIAISCMPRKYWLSSWCMHKVKVRLGMHIVTAKKLYFEFMSMNYNIDHEEFTIWILEKVKPS